MRLCFITPEYVTEPSYSGGLANYLGRVTVALAQRGHEVHVLTRADPPESVVHHHGVTVHRVVPLWDRRMILDHADPLVPRKWYNVYQDLKSAWSLWRRWKHLRRQMKFDLVQAANVQAVGLFFRYETTLPVVTRLSSHRPTWDTLAGMADHPGATLRWKLEQRAVEDAPFLYAPSHYVARQVMSHYRTVPVRVVETPFFPEELNPDRAAYDEYGAGRRYLLFFGRLTQMKGAHVLAQALPRVLRQLPDAHALLIGPSGQAPDGGDMRHYVRRQVAEFADRVRLLDRMRHDLLYPILEHARLIVLPSLADNLPNTCLEAMGHGKVIIATTGSCFEQLITDGQSGFLVPPGDPRKLEEAIIKAWNMSDDQLDAIGAAARKRIDELHPDVAIPRLIDYYERVIGEFARWRRRA